MHHPVQSGRASAEPAHSTVDIMPVQLDSLPMSPTRSKAQGSRRASVPGRLSVPASVLVGFGKEKKTGNKKRLQQRRSCEGSSRSSSGPLSPAQADPQTRTEERGSSGEGAMALTPSPESEGEVSKQPSFEDFKSSPGKRKPPLLRQDSSLSITSTTSDGEQVIGTTDTIIQLCAVVHTHIHCHRMYTFKGNGCLCGCEMTLFIIV